MNRKRVMNKGFANSFKGNFGQGESDKKGDIPYAMLKAARSSGQLNLSGRGLFEIPEKVWRINVDVPEEAKSVTLGDSDERWWDQVDLKKLIIASNKVKEIPDHIKHLPALNVLDAHDNEIEKISEEICELKEITKIHLNHNKLATLPKSFVELSSLKCLLLSDNIIEVLPDDFGYLCNIEELDLSNNKLISLPETFGNIKSLKKVNLSSNQLNMLPVGFENLTQLMHLNLNANKLQSLPPGFGKLRSLEILECRYNFIKQFTPFDDEAQVKQLFLGNNRIQVIDENVFVKLPHLVTLDLSDNAISTIPESLATLKLLERIELSNNSLTGLPYTMGTMNLKSLNLSGNPFRSIRRDILARGTQAILDYLKSRMPVEPSDQSCKVVEESNERKNNNNYDCKSNQQDHVDSKEKPVVKKPNKDVIDTYVIATTKVLSHSGENIPNNFWLPGASISKITLTKSGLKEFPKEIFNYSSTLGELNLSMNMLQSLPSCIESLEKLTYLDVSNNQLSDFPINIAKLKHLMQICASTNQFKNIPSSLFEMQKLETLLISGNQINEINVDGLLKLKCLTTLDLSNNNISRIPPTLGNVSWLKSLSLEGNAFRQPRPQIMIQGTQYVLEYLRDRIPR